MPVMAVGSVEPSARPAAAQGLWLLATALTLAAALCVGLALSAPGGPPSGAIDTYTMMFLVLAPLYASVGAVIISRAAGNRVGWVILVVGLILAVEDFSGDLTSLAQTAGGHWVPAPEWWNWLSGWAWVPGVVAALAFLPIYFPDGRTLSKRWQPIIWAIAIGSGVMLVGVIFSPDAVTTSGPAAPFANPVGIDAVGRLAPAIHGIYVAVLLGGSACGVFTLVNPYLRGSSDERHQIKWFAGAFALFGLMIGSYGAAAAFVNPLADWLIAAIIVIGLAVIPLSVAVAVLRYRLYDIDVDRKSTRLNSSHQIISYAVFCLKKKNKTHA